MITYTDTYRLIEELEELFNFNEESYPDPTIFIRDPDMIRDIFLKHIQSDDTSEYWDENYYLDLNILGPEHEFLVSLRNTYTEERTVRIRIDYYNISKYMVVQIFFFLMKNASLHFMQL